MTDILDFVSVAAPIFFVVSIVLVLLGRVLVNNLVQNKATEIIAKTVGYVGNVDLAAQVTAALRHRQAEAAAQQRPEHL